MVCSSAVTTARQPGWPGCASHRLNRTRDTCSNTLTPQRLAGARPAFGHRAACTPKPLAQDRPRGSQMTPADLAKFEPPRRYATLVALTIEGMATVTDEIIDLHDRILSKLFNDARKKHPQQFQASSKAINAQVRLFGRIGQALIDAKQSGG